MIHPTVILDLHLLDLLLPTMRLGLLVVRLRKVALPRRGESDPCTGQRCALSWIVTWSGAAAWFIARWLYSVWYCAEGWFCAWTRFVSWRSRFHADACSH